MRIRGEYFDNLGKKIVVRLEHLCSHNIFYYHKSFWHQFQNKSKLSPFLVKATGCIEFEIIFWHFLVIFFRTGIASKCWYRCLFAKEEMECSFEKWRTLNGSIRINCDFVETHCVGKNMTIFRYIHTQVGGS